MSKNTRDTKRSTEYTGKIEKTSLKGDFSVNNLGKEVRSGFDSLVSKNKEPKNDRKSENVTRHISTEEYKARKNYENFRKEKSGRVKINKKHLFILFLPFIIIIAGLIIYIHKLSHIPLAKDPGLKAGEAHDVYEFGPLHPFEMCSMRKPDLFAQLGEPMGRGLGEDDDSKFYRYEYEWFGFTNRTRIYYGREQRIYKAVVDFEDNSYDEVYKKLIESLGTPVDIDEQGEYKDVFWILDSVKYWLSLTDENVPTLEMRLAYYDNPDEYNLSDRPTIIQEDNSHDVTGDRKNDKVLLIGSKAGYTQTVYRYLFVIVGDGKKSHVVKFPKESDGGYYPKLSFEKHKDRDAIVITAENTYAVNENKFLFEKDKLENISSDLKPIKVKSK